MMVMDRTNAADRRRRRQPNENRTSSSSSSASSSSSSTRTQVQNRQQQRRRQRTATSQGHHSLTESPQQFRRNLYRWYATTSILLAFMAITMRSEGGDDAAVTSTTTTAAVVVVSATESLRHTHGDGGGGAVRNRGLPKRHNPLEQLFRRGHRFWRRRRNRKGSEGQHQQHQQQHQNGPLGWIPRLLRAHHEPPPPPTPPPSYLSRVISKITNSTWRGLVVSNCVCVLLSMLQHIVTSLFLGTSSMAAIRRLGGGNSVGAGSDDASSKMGGYWVIQLLLLTTVVNQQSVALQYMPPLVLWFACLFFWKSIMNQAGASVVHTAHSGQTPNPGALHLLSMVLFADALALIVCYKYLHHNTSLLCLFWCDWIVLGTDCVRYLLHYTLQIMEKHQAQQVDVVIEAKSILEKRRRELEQDSNCSHDDDDTSDDSYLHRQRAFLAWDESEASLFNDLDGIDDTVKSFDLDMVNEPHVITPSSSSLDLGAVNLFEEECCMLDRRLEAMESLHAVRIQLLDSTMFALDLSSHLLKTAHFVHIWLLHGGFRHSFTLIDGVLVLHTYSTLSSAAQKVGERLNTNRIARDLNAMFPDATEAELQKSECCCICLNSMRRNGSKGGAKRVACGHIYHTQCLREIMERARSVQAAKCPLCRAAVLSPTSCNRTHRHQSTAPAATTSTYQFTARAVLPSWIPTPTAFGGTRNNRHGAQPSDSADSNAHQQRREQQQQEQRQQQQQYSLLRQLYTLFFGAAYLSQEDEREALSQLVDMFPQYAREDLQRELRLRRSPDAVVQSILLGVFVSRHPAPSSSPIASSSSSSSLDAIVAEAIHGELIPSVPEQEDAWVTTNSNPNESTSTTPTRATENNQNELTDVSPEDEQQQQDDREEEVLVEEEEENDDNDNETDFACGRHCLGGPQDEPAINDDLDSAVFTVVQQEGEQMQYVFPEEDQTSITPSPRRRLRSPC